MASSSSLFAIFLLLACSSLTPAFASLHCHKINAIYQFGDSIADTGNLIRESEGGGSFSAITKLPYGETTFGKATGRCSDGLLMIDYLAYALGLPLLNPYLDKKADFKHGVNFAVAGATALSKQYFQEKGVVLPYTISSLDVQLQWFKNHLNTVCSSKEECAKKLKHALILMGEIGGNDYNYIFFQEKSLDAIVNSVPDIVQGIINATKEVIEAGALHIVVPGNFPIGCMPAYLSAFSINDSSAYDHNGCMTQISNLAMLHNEVLQKALKQLRQEHPHVLIMYADYYRAFIHLINNAVSLGFREDSMLKACCGAGGDYNFNATTMCGAEGATVCKHPDEHISWDGIHLTQAAYKVMAEELINEGFTYPSCRNYYSLI